MTGKAFSYLKGKVAADDAPMMDNPSRLYCRKCRAQNRMVCDDPGFCGNLEPMKPLPASDTVIEQKPQPHTPRPGSAELKRTKPLLDDSAPKPTAPRREAAQSRPRPAKERQEAAGHAFDRVMGRRTTITQGPLVDGEEKSWEWFMENVQADIDKLNGKD